MISFVAEDFPNPRKLVRAKWATILFRPILGSPEQFVIAVAVVGSDGIHLERANTFHRLNCLFKNSSKMTEISVQAALDAVEDDLLGRSFEALGSHEALLSGISIGPIQDGEGPSLEQIGSTWMSAISSLYERPLGHVVQVANASLSASVDAAMERLPSLILSYVIKQRPGLGAFFNADIRLNRQRRKNAHGVLIDFSGSRLVANFGVLSPSSDVNSVGKIKTRLWDLRVDRGAERAAFARRSHEMIIQRPRENDPQMTEKQVLRMREALLSLEEQADQQEIRLRALHSVEEIGQHILLMEAASSSASS
jgi:hypothetical protein